MKFEKELAELGFHKYHLLIIDSLLNQKKTAKQVSEEKKIPMGRIYDFLNQLIEEGIVEYEIITPTVYYINDFEKKLVNYLDNFFLEKIKKQNELFEAIKTTKPVVKPIYTTNYFDKVVDKERMAKNVKFIKKIRRDTSYPFFFYPEDYDESVKYLVKIHNKPVSYFKDPVKQKLFVKAHENQKETYSKYPTQLMVSMYSIDYFFKAIKEHFGKEDALKKLKQMKKNLSKYPLIKFKISKERFPYHLMVTNQAAIIALREEKVNKKNLVGTYFKGGNIIKQYSEIFNLKFKKAVGFNEYYETLLEKIKKE